jgi:hypothetical protein
MVENDINILELFYGDKLAVRIAYILNTPQRARRATRHAPYPIPPSLLPIGVGSPSMLTMFLSRW